MHHIVVTFHSHRRSGEHAGGALMASHTRTAHLQRRRTWLAGKPRLPALPLAAALIALALLAILAVIKLWFESPATSGGTESVRTPCSQNRFGFGVTSLCHWPFRWSQHGK